MFEVIFGYILDKIFFRNVDLDVQFDFRIGIVGFNGVGKIIIFKFFIGKLQFIFGIIIQNFCFCIGFFVQYYVDVFDFNVSVVIFMVKIYFGRMDEEYCCQLGVFGIIGIIGL